MTTLSLPAMAVRPGDRVCCALSGGADSVALLLLVHAANTQPRNALGVGLTAIHVNHGLRGKEAEGDEAFVVELCDRLGIPLVLERVDTLAHAAGQHETIEEAARNLRYDRFRALIDSGQAHAVLTAHTLDDQAETVLMKLLRGAWTEGLAGISPVLEVPGGRILRPLLGTSKAELHRYLEGREQSWREDSSNSDEAFTRNRIRHHVLPLLRAENPSIDRTLANLAEIAREEESRWTTQLDRLLPQLILPGKPVRGGGRSASTAPGAGSVALEIERLRPLDAALRRRVLRAAARQIGARLSFDETNRLLMLSGFPAGPPDPTVPTKPGSKLQLSGGLLAERSSREIRLSLVNATPRPGMG
jgi:tRNA(Ile)-lysidine synthase